MLGTNNTQKISKLIIIVLTSGTSKTDKGGGGVNGNSNLYFQVLTYRLSEMNRFFFGGGGVIAIDYYEHITLVHCLCINMTNNYCFKFGI